MATLTIVNCNNLSGRTFTGKLPYRKQEALENGEAYRGPAIMLETDGSNGTPTTQWAIPYEGQANLKVYSESDKREIKFKVTGEQLENIKHLQELLIETVRRDGEQYGVDVDEDECVGKKFLTISEDGTQGTLTLKLKDMTNFFTKKKAPLQASEGELLADKFLSNPNTKVSVLYQPNGAYVLDGVAHLSAVVKQIRLLDSGVGFTQFPNDEKVDATDHSDPNLENYNLKRMDELDPEAVSFSFTSPMGSLFKQNLLYRFKGVNKFLVTQTDYGFTFGIELTDRDDPMSKKQIKIYNPVSDEQSNAYYEGFRKIYDVLNQHMTSGEFKTIIGKNPKKNTTKGKEIKPREGYTGDTRRINDGLSGSCKANTWIEQTIRDGEKSLLNKISLKIPTNKEDNSVAVPVFDEEGASVDPTLLENRTFFDKYMVRAIFQINGVWISKATGFGLMTSVKQLHVKSKGGSGGGSSTTDGSEYITFDKDPEVSTEGLSEEFTKSLDTV